MDDVCLAALTMINALEAEHWPDVQAFRRIVGRLLRPEACVGWIQEQARQEGDPVLAVEVPCPAGVRPFSPEHIAFLQARAALPEAERPSWRGKISCAHLEYVGPYDACRRSVSVVNSGLLDALRVLSDRLAKAFGWDPANATVFILTNAVPPTPKGVVTIAQGEHRDRIAIEVPPTLTDDEILELYRKASADLVDTRGRASRSDKASRRAVWIVRHNDGRTWSNAFDAWKAELAGAGDDAGDDLQRFRRRCLDDYRRITGRELEWRGKSRPGRRQGRLQRDPRNSMVGDSYRRVMEERDRRIAGAWEAAREQGDDAVQRLVQAIQTGEPDEEA